MGDSGLGSNVVLKLTGVSYRQLDYWARTGLVGSSIRQAKGHGSRRVYSFQDLVALRVVARCRRAPARSPRRSATWRTVSSGGCARRSSNNGVTKSSELRGRYLPRAAAAKIRSAISCGWETKER